MRCGEVKTLLEALGFIVSSKKSGGHKGFIHSGIPEFYGSNYNCGHGKNPELKPSYLKNILKVLETYEVELKSFLSEQKK